MLRVSGRDRGRGKRTGDLEITRRGGGGRGGDQVTVAISSSQGSEDKRQEGKRAKPLQHALPALFLIRVGNH